ncbi:MAG: TIGR03619 family F420-dependent LLM class oxidoreductase [Acidimicrobiales bacterium]
MSGGLSPRLVVGLPSFAAEDPGDWSHLFRQARLLDRGGVDRLVVSDHVVFGERLEEYGRPEIGGRRGGTQPTGPDGHWLEPLTTLAALVGTTDRVRLGTNILVAALRRPVVLAKTAATIDVLSGGRLDLGVGVGWQREEYEAAGLAFEGRGALLDRTLEVCRTLWDSERAEYRSDDLAFEAIHMMPKPRQAGGVPIWVSGTVNRRVAGRLARFGSGWIPWGDAADDVVAGIASMQGALEEAGGRDMSEIRVVGTLRLRRRPDGATDAEATMAPVAELAAAGVTDFAIGMLRFPEDDDEAIEMVSELVSAFRSAAGLRPVTP